MGVKLASFVLALTIIATPSALAQKSTEDGLRDCERLAAIKFRQENPAFKKFDIARAFVQEDKFADKVGTQFVSTVYHGKAIYQADGAPDNVGLLCLHGGLGKGAVFIYTLPR